MGILIADRCSDDFAGHGEYLGHARHRGSGVALADHLPTVPPGRGRVEAAEDVHDAPVPCQGAECPDTCHGRSRGRRPGETVLHRHRLACATVGSGAGRQCRYGHRQVVERA
ncbi:hypothetical protein [Streptomyces candidus]|uniref:Uncharacterized protein n=1 Tax=Streptomyces candidus TaxID=67283 RepID=A0A7X0HCK3_9ACTN|nr:hypothetical protein [Streptomyces candidus]MBB6435160.1 hypothetical protein [Streptomyces candidus]GHH40651.1 hypothetical protein GCM10018773_22080 [Streptomyces candidus]